VSRETGRELQELGGKKKRKALSVVPEGKEMRANLQLAGASGGGKEKRGRRKVWGLALMKKKKKG